MKIKKYKNNHPFVFYFLVIYLGGILTYLFIFIAFFADYSEPLELNELGDFLAGSFSPLAFLFLYLGYKQQGEELRNALGEQKKLIEIHLQEKESKHFSIAPNLQFQDGCIEILQISTPNPNPDYNNRKVTINFKNFGGEIRDFFFFYSSSGSLISKKDKIEKNEIIPLTFYFQEKEALTLKNSNFSEVRTELNFLYYDALGKQYTKNITCDVKGDFMSHDYWIYAYDVTQVFKGPINFKDIPPN